VVHHFLVSPKVIFGHSIHECIKKSQCVNQLDLSVNKEQYVPAQGVFSPLFTEESMSEDIAESDVALPAVVPVISAQPGMHGCTSISAMHATSSGGEAAVQKVMNEVSLPHVNKGAEVQSIDGIMMIREEQPVRSPSVTPVGVNKVHSFSLQIDTDIGTNEFSSPNQLFSSKVFEDSPSYDHSMTEVINFGGIANDSMKGIRSSAGLRAQSNSDYTQMERAMMLANKRDQQQSQGTPALSIPSFSAFSDEQIIAKADGLGVSLGVNLEERLHAARLIKDIEKQRMLTFLNTNSTSENESLPLCLAVSRASNICEDLDEVDEPSLDDNTQFQTIRQVTKGQRKKSLITRQKLGEASA
jgi:hypothetical protein